MSDAAKANVILGLVILVCGTIILWPWEMKWMRHLERRGKKK